MLKKHVPNSTGKEQVMIDNTKELKKQLIEIESMMDELRRKEKIYKDLPEGRMRVTTSKKNAQFYYATPTSPAYKYLPASEKEFIKKFLQREYDRKAAKILLKMKNATERSLFHNVGELRNAYEKLCKGRKNFFLSMKEAFDKSGKNSLHKIKPLNELSEIAIFLAGNSSKSPLVTELFTEQGKYETEAGEYVRSKSEKIIADTFKKMNIPYIYEPKIILDRNKTVFPDFACLNVRKRKTIFWEHLGLTDLPDYAVKNFAKLDIYEKNGYFIGDDIIISTETQEHPLDISTIKRKIERYLY